MKHERKCWDCGSVAEHEDNIVPHVLCKLCGSQDTRPTRKKNSDISPGGDYRDLTLRAVRGLKALGSWSYTDGSDPHPLDCTLAGRVCHVFGVGMTRAIAICCDANEDPEYRERHCASCDILVDDPSNIDEVGFCNHCAINADH